MKRQFLIHFTTTFAIFLLNAKTGLAGVGVGAGNDAGESIPSFDPDQEKEMPRPEPPSQLETTLKSSTSVLLEWQGVLARTGDKFSVFRAKDDDSWSQISPMLTDNHFVDSTIEPDHLYRYKVATVGKRRRDCMSPPSNERIVANATSKIVAGAVAPFGVFNTVATGWFSIDRFVPDLNPMPSPPPEPFVLNGPFSLLREDSWGNGEEYQEQAGAMPIGIALSQSAFIDPLSRTSWAFTRVESDWPHYEATLPTYLGVTEDGWWYEGIVGSAAAGFFRAGFEGDILRGFDAVNNPKWQMVPSDASRPITIKISPDVAPRGAGEPQFEFTTEDDSYGFFPQGETSVLLLGSQTRRESQLKNESLKATLGMDMPPLEVVAVKIHLVRYAWRGPILGNAISTKVPIVQPEISIQNELNSVYLQQSNIQFLVSVDPTPLDFFQQWESKPDDAAVDMSSDESAFFANKSRIDVVSGYRCSVFVFEGSAHFRSRGGEPNRLWGTSDHTPGRFAFVATKDGGGVLIDVLAHELGHLLGLDHAFEEGFTGNFVIPDDPSARVMGYDRYLPPSSLRLIKLERDLLHRNAAKPSTEQ